jgi:putative acetyltransferase
MQIRPFKIEDLEAVVQVYRESVRRFAPSRYTPMQIEAWTRYPTDMNEFGERMLKGCTLVAEEDGFIHAFGQLEPCDFFSFLYTDGKSKTKNLGSLIYDVLETKAYADGVVDLYTEVGSFGRLFGERRGYVVYETFNLTHFGVELEWYRMKKSRETGLAQLERALKSATKTSGG